MNGQQLLSEIVFKRTYSQVKPDGTQESEHDAIERVANMHKKKFPRLSSLVTDAFAHVHARRVVPSMRTMQFAGEPIERSNARAFNCAFTSVQSHKDFSDIFWLLMNGCGVGFSAQHRHVISLPIVNATGGRFFIGDNKEAWADSVSHLIQNPRAVFDYSAIRPAGSLLSTGGTASGPEPLRLAHEKMREILVNAGGRQLKPIEVHDLVCHMADAVVVGGVRRAALISLFDHNDDDMSGAKSGAWWEKNPQRARANNSAVVLRSAPSRAAKVLTRALASPSGEPGIHLTNNLDMGTNPCGEVSLRDKQFCNLTEINLAACQTVDEMRRAVWAASVIGTLQASYTNFSYIQPQWKKNTEEDALLGVSFTGQAERWDMMRDENLAACARIALTTNADTAIQIGINPAARIGCVKPSGTTSAWLGCTSGIHAAHARFYLRRVRLGADTQLAKRLVEVFGLEPGGVVEPAREIAGHIVVTVPVAKEGSILREDESAVDLLKRSAHVQKNWIDATHRRGDNRHSVSLTVAHKAGEATVIAKWCAENWDAIGGVSFLPHEDHAYDQAPFEAVSFERFVEFGKKFIDVDVDLSTVHDAQVRSVEPACAGGVCEIRTV